MMRVATSGTRAQLDQRRMAVNNLACVRHRQIIGRPNEGTNRYGDVLVRLRPLPNVDPVPAVLVKGYLHVVQAWRFADLRQYLGLDLRLATRLLGLFHHSGFFLVRDGLLDLSHCFPKSSGSGDECIIPAFDPVWVYRSLVIAGIVRGESGTICCFTNQLREKIGVMFGNPETTTGGKALKFYATIRLDIRRIETLKDGTEAIGNRVRVKVVKNKVAPPFKQAEFDIMYGAGISREGTLLDLGVACEVVQKSGAFFSYKEERIGQGRANGKMFLAENPDIADAIEAEIRERAGLPAVVLPASTAAQGKAEGKATASVPAAK